MIWVGYPHRSAPIVTNYTLRVTRVISFFLVSLYELNLLILLLNPRRVKWNYQIWCLFRRLYIKPPSQSFHLLTTLLLYELIKNSAKIRERQMCHIVVLTSQTWSVFCCLLSPSPWGCGVRRRFPGPSVSWVGPWPSRTGEAPTDTCPVDSGAG